MPRGATLIDNALSVAPGFQIGNVYVMAGVPRVMQSMFEWLAPRLAPYAPPLVPGHELEAPARASFYPR